MMRSLRFGALLGAALISALQPAVADGEVQVRLEASPPLRGTLRSSSPEGLELDVDGWRVRVPTRDVLLLSTSGRAPHVPAAVRAEDLADHAASRGKFSEGLDRMGEAILYLLRSLAQGALPAREGSADLEVALRRAQFFAAQSGRPGHAVAICDAVIDAAGPTPHCQDVARRYRAEFLRMLGDPAAAEADQQAQGVVTSFFLAGPFDNERGTGFAEDQGPEQAAFDPAASFPGKKHRVGWRPHSVASPPGGVVDLDAQMLPRDQALAYAVTFLHAKERTPVALRLGSDEAVRLWVGGREVLTRKVRRPYRPDQDHVGVVLAPGWNRVLLKVCDQTGPWRFRLRVTAPEGGEAAGVRVATLEEIAAGPKPASEEVELAEIDRGALSVLEARAERYPQDWRALYHLGYMHYAVQAHDRTAHPDRDRLQAAVRLEPKRADLRVLLSITSSEESEFSVNREDNALRAHLEDALELDPDHHHARSMLAEYYRRLGNRDRARALLKPILEKAPEYVAARLLALQLDEVRGLRSLSRAALSRLLDEAEGRVQADEAEAIPAGILAMALGVARSQGNVSRQIELTELMLEGNRAQASWVTSLAGLQEEAGQPHLATELLRQAVHLDPYSVALRKRLAEIHQRHDRWADAAGVLEAAIDLCPHDPSLHEALGRVLERRGREEAASASFERALELDPSRVELARYVAYRNRNQEQEAPFEEPWIVDPAPLVAKAKGIPLDPRRPRRVLFHQEVDRLGTDGMKRGFVQEVIRIENEVGARDLATYSAIYSSDQRIEFQQARVYRQGGGVEDAPVGSSRGRRRGEFSSRMRFPVRFPPLEPGDVIAVRYRLDDREEGFFGDYYGKVVYFQDEVAVDWLRYVLLAPKERKLYFHTKGLEVTPERKVEGDQSVTVYQRRDVAPLESEPNMPWAKEVVPQVQVSTFEDWDAFARWYWSLVSGQHEADPAIRAKVRELVAGAKTDEEKVRRIYHYVVTEIRYNASWEFGIHGFKPYNATKIYARKFGDCKDKATLIGTMLKEAGVEAWPVLIFGEDERGTEDLALPLMTHFNHCISWVNLDGDRGKGGVFVDGTAEHHPYPTLPSMDYGAKVVVITPDRGVVRDIPYLGAEANSVTEEHRVKVHPGGKAELKTVIGGEGRFGVVLRDILETEGRRKEVIEPQLGRSFSGARVTRVETSDLEDLNAPVRVEIDVELPSVLRQTAGGGHELQPIRSWLFDALYLRGQRISGLAADPERTHDVVLSVPSAVNETVTFELPESVRVERIPPPVLIEQPFGTYRLEYSQDGPRLRVHRTLELKTQRISREDYEAFRRFVRDIEQAEQQRPLLGGAEASE